MATLTATYSPDDNKLRLYTLARLDEETYQRVSAAGFRFAPKQDLFAAPSWTPEREDLLLELCGEIDDDDTSLVERAEARADRFGDYQDKRAAEADAARRSVNAIAEGIPLGQPILVGHHSERRARKDAERIENGMRKSLQLWDTAQYWQHRAAGALRHAKYKERADVRARRIKTIEADRRQVQRQLDQAVAALAVWEQADLTMERALWVADHGQVSQCFPLAEYPRAAPASQYEGAMSVWSALKGGVISVEQARGICVSAYKRSIERAGRWIAHYGNRLAYERAMLLEQGGLITQRLPAGQAIEVGGQVLVGGQWVRVLRVNRSGDQVASVRTSRRYGSLCGIEELQDYRAPTAEESQRVAQAMKLPPIANYPGPGFIHITQAQWDKLPKDYKGLERVPASATAAAHRVRHAIGVYLLRGERDDNRRHAYHRVYITDAKTKEPPAAAQASAPASVALATLPAPMPVDLVATAPGPAAAGAQDFERMRAQLRAGVQVVSAPQLFPTPPDLAARMVGLAGVREGVRLLEPSAGTGRMIDAMRATGLAMHIVAVEHQLALVNALAARYDAERGDVPQEVELVARDFLTVEPGRLGWFDAVLMNPPFERGADIAHITHALQFLKEAGRLVALCANGPRQNEVLRPLVEARGGTWEVLPEGTFAAEGTQVRVALMVIPG